LQKVAVLGVALRTQRRPLSGKLCSNCKHVSCPASLFNRGGQKKQPSNVASSASPGI
jgi:hypothetical protein